MDERSESHSHETDPAKGYDDISFIAKQDVQLAEGITRQDDVLQIQSDHRKNNILESKSDSALWRKDAERTNLSRSMKDSINLTNSFGADKSITNISNVKLQTCQLSNSESRFLYDKESFDDSFANRTSVSLPVIPISSESSSIKGKINESENNVHTHRNIPRICTNDKETLFNQPSKIQNPSSDSQCSANKNGIVDACQNNPPEHEDRKQSKNENLKEQIISNDVSKIEQYYEEIIDSRSHTTSNETLNKKNQEIEGDSRKENKSSSALSVNVHARNSVPRPTLADDNKLVKMSILTNPINMMPSNVQLLNKSRNFLNFITEKSTNIMEKALLPQHLAMRYNYTSKSVESDIESSSRNVTCSLDMDVAKPDNTPDTTSYTVKRNHGKSNTELGDAINNGDLEDSPAYTKVSEVRDLESETIQNDAKSCTFEKRDVNKLDYYRTTDGARSVLSLRENKGNFSQTEKLHDDKKDLSDICTAIDSDIAKYGSLEHPLHAMLLEDYTSLKFKNLKLLKRLERLEYLEKSDRSNRSFREIQTNTDACTLQAENLERAVNKLVGDLNAALITQDTLRNECAAVNKEKENMVMKYVISEKQLIDSQRAKDSTERKVKELLKDQELLQSKLRQVQGERTKVCNIADGKCREITELQKEIERLKEDAKSKEVKLKWTQNKLKMEMDTQKDTQQKLDKALMKINDMKEECEQIRRETQESFRKFQQSEENKAVTLDQQLKEHQARLILERHVTEDKETLRLQLQKELETLKSRQQDLIEENRRLSLKVQELEKARLNYENNLSDLKIVANQRQEQITELLSKVCHLETLKLQLQHKEEYITSIELQMQQLRSVNEELQSDMQACREKEADMLDFTQKLTDKNVCLQSDFTVIQAKVNHLVSEHGPLRNCINELTSKVKTVEEELAQEQRKRREECEILAKHVAEQTQLAQNLAQKLEDSQGENAVLKRKHQISIKEMTRELQQCRRKLEMFEAASPSNSLDITSRTGSNTSLNIGELNGALSDNNANGDHIHSVEPSRQVLMDHIIKLQKINVKRAEKLDLLEEHTQELVEAIQKKNKIIQTYILKQNFGALGCNERDRHKAELARHGGIMASVYNNRVSDENMTLELSLEINQKLQAVLEDALLKNITLKDNIDTLGNEIEKLTMQHQQRQVEN